MYTKILKKLTKIQNKMYDRKYELYSEPHQPDINENLRNFIDEIIDIFDILNSKIKKLKETDNAK